MNGLMNIRVVVNVKKPNRGLAADLLISHVAKETVYLRYMEVADGCPEGMTFALTYLLDFFRGSGQTDATVGRRKAPYTGLPA